MIIVEEYIKSHTKKERQSHIDLSEVCLERGGLSTHHRGVLAEYLDTNIPKRPAVLAHACGNGNCSNPKHLYWATYRENTVEDGKKFGTFKTIWERSVEKYGLEEAKNKQRVGGHTTGTSNLRKRK